MVSIIQNIKLKTNKNKISYIFNEKDQDNLRLETIETILKESIFENESKICFKNFLLKTKIDSNGDINFLNENNKDYDITEKIVLNSILKLNLGNDIEEQNILSFKKKMNINDNNEDINVYSKIFNSISLVIHKVLHRKSITNEKNVEKCIYFSDFTSKKVIVGVGAGDDEANEKEKNNSFPEINKSIYKIIEKNKNFEFFSIKSIIISFVNLVSELVNNYLEVKEKNNIFEIIYNDFLLKSNLCSAELEDVFSLNLDNFQKKFKMNFTLSELFTQIFWNFIFHNKTLYNLLIISYLELDTNEVNKIFLKKILKILCNVSVPLKYQITEILNIYKIPEKDDLMSLIVEEKNKHHNEIVQAEIEKKNNNNNNNNLEKKNEDNEHKNTNINTNTNKNMNNNLSKNEKGNNYNNIIIANDISTIKSKKQNEKNEEKEKKEKKEEKEKKEKKEEKEEGNDGNNENGIDLEHKTVEEIYNYINEDKVSKTKKKKRARKNKKNKKENIEENKNEKEDIIVVKFKEDLKGKLFHAGNFKKIKPKLSEEWIKNISSYY